MKFLLYIAALAGAFLLIGCNPMTRQEREYKKSKVSISQKNNRVTFHLSDVVNGIRVIKISDVNTGEVIWKVYPQSYKKNNIIYGNMNQFLVVSQTPGRPPKQEIPNNYGKAPSLKGRLIRAEFEVQYDTIMSANVGIIEEIFQM